MKMRIRIAVLQMTAALWLLPALLGCKPKPKTELAANEVIEQTYKVEPNASLRIANPRGSITIHGEDTSEMRIRAVKSASSAAQLKEITLDVTAEPGDVLIKTAFPRKKNMPFFAGKAAVDYTLSVPRSTRIARVDADDGNVSIEGIQNSNVWANIVNGQLNIQNYCGDLNGPAATDTTDQTHSPP